VPIADRLPDNIEALRKRNGIARFCTREASAWRLKRPRNNGDPSGAARWLTVSFIRFGFWQALLVIVAIGFGCSSTDSNVRGPGAADQSAGRGGQGGTDAAEMGGASGRASAGMAADAGNAADAGESAGGSAGDGGEPRMSGGGAGRAGSGGADSIGDVGGKGGSGGAIAGSSAMGGGSGRNECVWDATHPDNCPVCDAHDGCSQPGYKYIGSGAITSSCCGLEWQEETAPSAYTWTDAIDYCATLPLLEGAWRLPKIAELYSLVTLSDASHTSPSIDVDAFADTERALYWSSSPDGTAADWSVNFSDGTSQSVSADAQHKQRVRCVR